MVVAMGTEGHIGCTHPWNPEKKMLLLLLLLLPLASSHHSHPSPA
jgi:hypothetical protein